MKGFFLYLFLFGGVLYSANALFKSIQKPVESVTDIVICTNSPKTPGCSKSNATLPLSLDTSKNITKPKQSNDTSNSTTKPQQSDNTSQNITKSQQSNDTSKNNTKPPLPDDTTMIKFHVWKKGINNAQQYYELKYGNEMEASKIFNFGGDHFSTFFFFHNVGTMGLTKWILDSTNALLRRGHYKGKILVIYPDYSYLVPDNRKAIINAQAIADHISTILYWAFKSTDSIRSSGHNIFIGHGIGANISFSVARKMQTLSNNTFVPNILTALDPYIATPADLLLLPASSAQSLAIKKTSDFYIIAYHTSTCSQTTVIPACQSNSSETLGDTDFFPNGGTTQPGCKINDFRCSNLRAAYLFVEEISFAYVASNSLFSYGCPSYEAFQAGTCSDCRNGCLVMNGLTKLEFKGRFYCETNAKPIYGSGKKLYDSTNQGK